MSLELAKLVYAYDMELVNQELDYANDCRMYFMWYKPEMRVRFKHATQAWSHLNIGQEARVYRLHSTIHGCVPRDRIYWDVTNEAQSF